jgi:2'-hydroxyisoflavone reductase
MQRRDFLRRSLSAASLCVPVLPTLATAKTTPQRILVLGGTRFVGPAFVEAAIASGHIVTLFNRGMTNPDLFSNVEKLRGFRSPEDLDFSALASRHFDIAIDIWPSDPVVVAAAAEFLAPRVRHYLYVSSIAAYDSANLDRADLDETAPLEPWDGKGREYSRGKAESERRLHAIFGEKLTVVRPGPIKGMRDTQPDLLTWLMRSQSGGRHIGPGSGSDPVELVDVRDVARFLVHAIDRSHYGTFNLTGRPRSFRDFLGACNSAMDSDAEFEWIPQDFLREHGLETDAALGIFAGNFPLWRPAGTQRGLFQISSEKAFRAGWRTRAFEETAFDCLAFFRSQRETLQWTDYLSADNERAVLSTWEQRHGGGG